MFEDVGSTRIDLACPRCQQLFKVRLRKLQFGADLVCRLCRHEFAAKEIADRPEVHEALARMQQIVKHRVRPMEPRGNTDGTEDPAGRIPGRHSACTRKLAQHLNDLPDDDEDAVDGRRTTSRHPTLRVS